MTLAALAKIVHSTRLLQLASLKKTQKLTVKRNLPTIMLSLKEAQFGESKRMRKWLKMPISIAKRTLLRSQSHLPNRVVLIDQ